MIGNHSANKAELRELRRLLSEYGVLRVEQLVSFLHNKEESVVRNMISYLARNEYISKDEEYAASDKAALTGGADRKVIAAFWVLLSRRKLVEYDSRGEFPAQIYFFAEGREYEVIYVAMNDEARIGSILTRREDAGVSYIVVVDEARQIEIIDIPNVVWFCTVERDGKLTKYIQED